MQNWNKLNYNAMNISILTLKLGIVVLIFLPLLYKIPISINKSFFYIKYIQWTYSYEFP